MVLRKCPKCKELYNPASLSCPRCGVVFKDLRRKRVLFWTVLLALVAWTFHQQLLHYLPITHLLVRD